jgi:hypothetical protein
MKATSHEAWKGSLAAMAVGLLLTACSAPATTPNPETAAPVAASAPALRLDTSYNELMVAWIDNASHVLWDIEKPGFAPKNDADWTEVEDHAIQVAAAGTLIQLPGVGPNDVVWSGQDGWKTNAELMSEAAGAALTAAKSRNLPAVVEANGKLVQACEGCHKQFKPDLPSEGIAHQRPHSETHKSN